MTDSITIKDLLKLFKTENLSVSSNDFSDFLTWLVNKGYMNEVLEINDNHPLSLKIQSLLQQNPTELLKLLSTNEDSLYLLTSNASNIDATVNKGTEIFIQSASIGRLKNSK